jgi:hypothetical protein
MNSPFVMSPWADGFDVGLGERDVGGGGVGGRSDCCCCWTRSPISIPSRAPIPAPMRAAFPPPFPSRPPISAPEAAPAADPTSVPVARGPLAQPVHSATSTTHPVARKPCIRLPCNPLWWAVKARPARISFAGRACVALKAGPGPRTGAELSPPAGAGLFERSLIPGISGDASQPGRRPGGREHDGVDRGDPRSTKG